LRVEKAARQKAEIDFWTERVVLRLRLKSMAFAEISDIIELIITEIQKILYIKYMFYCLE
jgi:acyl CoA:acetate/3-ketoacid CoA transferase